MKKAMHSKPATDVNSYLAALPPAERRLLKNLRATIRSTAPKAEEKISYGMPTYRYLGWFVGFAAFKDHCSFFVMSYRVMRTFRKELKPYKASTATLHFTPEKPLPVSLVKKILRARIKENEEKKSMKKSKM